jgi:hypothetical protein
MVVNGVRSSCEALATNRRWATLEQAYMELTRQAVEFRPAGFDADAAQEVPR